MWVAEGVVALMTMASSCNSIALVVLQVACYISSAEQNKMIDSDVV